MLYFRYGQCFITDMVNDLLQVILMPIMIKWDFSSDTSSAMIDERLYLYECENNANIGDGA